MRARPAVDLSLRLVEHGVCHLEGCEVSGKVVCLRHWLWERVGRDLGVSLWKGPTP